MSITVILMVLFMIRLHAINMQVPYVHICIHLEDIASVSLILRLTRNASLNLYYCLCFWFNHKAFRCQMCWQCLSIIMSQCSIMTCYSCQSKVNQVISWTSKCLSYKSLQGDLHLIRDILKQKVSWSWVVVFGTWRCYGSLFSTK